MDKFRVGGNQVDFAVIQYCIFNARQDRRNNLLRGIEDGKSEQASLPEVLMADLGTTGRETISATAENFLNHPTLLFEVLWCMQAQVNLQDSNYHDQNICRLKGCFLFLDLEHLDDITRLDVVVFFKADTTLVAGADFLDVILETA